MTQDDIRKLVVLLTVPVFVGIPMAALYVLGPVLDVFWIRL